MLNIDVIPGQRQGLVPVCGHTVIANFPGFSDGGHTGIEAFQMVVPRMSGKSARMSPQS